MQRTTRPRNGGSRTRRLLVSVAFVSRELLLTRSVSIAPPNFISDIFYLTLAANHIGQLKLVNNIEELLRQYDDVRRHLEVLQSDQSWRGVRYLDLSRMRIIQTRMLTRPHKTPYQARTEAAINAGKVCSLRSYSSARY